MKKITAGKWIILGLFLSAVFSVLLYRHLDGHEIESAAFLDTRDGFLYGMDITDQFYYLFRTEEDTGCSRTVRVPRIGGGSTTKISDLVAGEGGKVYFYYEKTGRTSSESKIAVCDFSWKGIKKLWDIEEITDGGVWLLQSEGEKILMETIETDNDDITEWLLDPQTMTWEKQGIYQQAGQEGEYNFGDHLQWRVCSEGNIYAQRVGTKEICVFENDGSQIGTSNCRYQAWNGGLHFLNLDSGENYVLEVKDGKGELHICDTCVSDAALKEQFGYVNDVQATDEGHALGFTWADGKKVPFVYGESSWMLLRLQNSPKDRVLCLLTLAAVAFLCLLAIYFIIRMIFVLNGGMFPLFAQILFVGFPLFVAVCILSSNTLDQLLLNRLLGEETDALVQAGTLYRECVKLDDEGLSGGAADDSKAENYLIRSAYYDMTDGQEKWKADLYYTNLYTCREGEIYELSAGNDRAVPVSYTEGKDFYDALQAAVEGDLPVTLRHQDVNGNWLSVFVPYHGDNGNTTAVVELREEIQRSLTRISEPVGQATNAIFTGFGVLAAAVLLILFFSLHSLGGLSRAVGEISEGKLDVQVREGLRFLEIGRISYVFNQMSLNISRNMRELTEIGRKYAMFIPVQFLGYLGKSSILKTEHGDYAEEEFVVMEISSSDFEAVSGTLTGQQTFDTINRALERIIPVLEQHEGMITDFINAGALSIYKKDGNQALSAAVSVIQSMNRDRLSAGETPLAYTAGICFGPVRLGIIGAGNRSKAAAVSLNCQFAGMLQHMAVKYGAGILITGEAVKRVKNFETDYHFRTLGYVLFSSKDVVDVVYDVYDGDHADQQQLKSQTKELFETGVQLYMGTKFLEARNCFVRVLFENRGDLAARQYFSFCEMQLNGEKDGKDCHYIEVF